MWQNFSLKQNRVICGGLYTRINMTEWDETVSVRNEEK